MNVGVGTQDDDLLPGPTHTTRVFIPAINDHQGPQPEGTEEPGPRDHFEDDQEETVSPSRSCPHQYTNGGFLSK